MIIRNILILCLFFSCENQRNIYIDSEIILELAGMSSNPVPPPLFVSVPFYIKNNDGTITQTTGGELKKIFDTYYYNKYTSFSDFLSEGLNQNIEFNRAEVLHNGEAFVVDSKISEYYKAGGIDSILKIYFIRGENHKGYFIKDSNLTSEELKSIFYYLFIEKYFVFEDDYTRKILIERMDAVIEIPVK